MRVQHGGRASGGAPVSEVAIRRALASDAAAIAAVHVAAWRESYPGLMPERMLSALSVQDRTKRWHGILTVPDPAMESTVFVAARPDETLVGFGSCGRQRTPDLVAGGFPGEFSALYVLAAHYGQGVGRGLMAEMARDLIGRQIHGAGLWVLRDNHRARRFYEALGGDVVGQRVESVDAHVLGEQAHRQGGGELHEVAYGWPDLWVLVPDRGPA
jgi:ribosomal protein S18 acetylase RimI-like enzyme